MLGWQSIFCFVFEAAKVSCYVVFWASRPLTQVILFLGLFSSQDIRHHSSVTGCKN